MRWINEFSSGCKTFPVAYFNELERLNYKDDNEIHAAAPIIIGHDFNDANPDTLDWQPATLVFSGVIASQNVGLNGSDVYCMASMKHCLLYVREQNTDNVN